MTQNANLFRPGIDNRGGIVYTPKDTKNRKRNKFNTFQ